MNELRPVFDYSVIAADLAAEARAVADRIRSRQQAAIMETGRDLLLMKERLGHGHFLKWIEIEFGMTRRTAVNYMTAVTALGPKWETVSHLPPTAIYDLAAPSTPEPIRQEIVSALEEGAAVSPAEIKDRVREGRQAAKTAEEKSRLSTDGRQTKEREQLRRERVEAKRRAEIEAAEAARRQALSAAARLIARHVPSIPDLLRNLDVAGQHALKREIEAFLSGPDLRLVEAGAA